MLQTSQTLASRIPPLAVDWGAREEDALPWELTLLTVPVHGGSQQALDRLLREVQALTTRSAVRVALTGDGVSLMLGLPPGATAVALRPLVEFAAREANTPDGDAL